MSVQCNLAQSWFDFFNRIELHKVNLHLIKEIIENKTRSLLVNKLKCNLRVTNERGSFRQCIDKETLWCHENVV